MKAPVPMRVLVARQDRAALEPYAPILGKLLCQFAQPYRYQAPNSSRQLVGFQCEKMSIKAAFDLLPVCIALCWHRELLGAPNLNGKHLYDTLVGFLPLTGQTIMTRDLIELLLPYLGDDDA